jgi:hypothetical protein
MQYEVFWASMWEVVVVRIEDINFIFQLTVLHTK